MTIPSPVKGKTVKFLIRGLGFFLVLIGSNPTERFFGERSMFVQDLVIMRILFEGGIIEDQPSTGRKGRKKRRRQGQRSKELVVGPSPYCDVPLGTEPRMAPETH